MIIQCNVCKGTGRFQRLLFSSDLCPACKGAGEYEITTPSAKIVTCKYCSGKGITQPLNLLDFSGINICPACKGVGLIERPVIGTTQTGNNEISVPQTPRLSRYEYDIAVSFAGEDRGIVKEYVDILSPKGLKVFYDKDAQVDLWGSNLYDKFDEIYRTKAFFCVIFISKHYAEKVWTNHERKSAQARALQENREYVLPVRLDDTEIPGIPSTIGSLDLREISLEELADMTIQKVRKLKEKKYSR